ncbi:PAAR domain-containing protein [Pararhizobium sp. BT-229]|uniref:PAAR domain-containing protein n=1 Tax=Pararhizobium sp. BT-229 TaxID=2986923 RepID=UPI0021F7AE8E|nr:PAAR domain-containing protein [Pararhizobium sp. BT-229]MCV9961730.1 PAAR domain-containing protein [Pararhizobium sp. BT-229]
MGMPAARLGDMTSHGTPLIGPSFCVTVLIEKKPAWRAGDTHLCPLVNGLQPHVGGSVAVGSVTVTIGGMPAARVGDIVAEAGGPNAIAAGATTVLIG